MNTFGISERSYNLLTDVLSKYPEVKEVVVFGSRAKGNYKPGSDIDIAIKGSNCTSKTALSIHSYLNESVPIPYHVDVVCYNMLESVQLKEHIDRVGKNLLHTSN